MMSFFWAMIKSGSLPGKQSLRMGSVDSDKNSSQNIQTVLSQESSESVGFISQFKKENVIM